MNQEQKTQSLIRQNRTSLGKKRIQRTATALMLLSSLLPFLNNFIKNSGLLDTTSIVFNNVAGARQLDLDSAIFFLAMPISYLLISIAGRLGAHKISYYAVYVSCYFQLMFITRFIFLDKNDIYYITQYAILAIFITIGIIVILIERYIKKVSIADEFRNKTLDRTLTMLSKKNTI